MPVFVLRPINASAVVPVRVSPIDVTVPVGVTIESVA
jgi:hypothetical protein